MNPLPEGMSHGDHIADDAIGRLQLNSKCTLQDLARDYVIFNHGAFFVHGRLDEDPVGDYVAKHPDPYIQAQAIVFDEQILDGLRLPRRPCGPALPWERTLLFVRREFWPGLQDHLRCCAWVDRARRRFARAVMQELAVVDFLALNHAVVAPGPLPTVPVTLFGVDGTHAHVQFAQYGLRQMPTVVPLPLVAETAKLGAALLAQDPQPFRSVESEDPFAGHQGCVSTPP